MSAPNEGRQSPDPERQSGAQIHDPVASKPNEQTDSKGSNNSKEELKNLESNPKHILEDHAKTKVSKET